MKRFYPICLYVSFALLLILQGCADHPQGVVPGQTYKLKSYRFLSVANDVPNETLTEEKFERFVKENRYSGPDGSGAFEYYPDGRLKKKLIVGPQGTRTLQTDNYTYIGNNQVEIFIEYHFGGLTAGPIVVPLNRFGYIENSDTEYNSEGYRVRSGTTTYTIVDGNIDMPGHEYDKTKLNTIAIPSLYGRSSKNLISKVTFSSGGYRIYEYIYDDKERIVKLFIRSFGFSPYQSLTRYTYEYYD